MPLSFVIKKINKLTEERVNSITRDIKHVDEKFGRIGSIRFTTSQQRTAHFALLHHVKRILRAIDDLSKQDGQVDLIVCKKKLDQLIIQITTSLEKIPPELEAKIENAKKIVLVGGGSVGFFSGVTLLWKQAEHKSNVVIVANKFTDFPSRSGFITDETVKQYYDGLGLINSHSANIEDEIRQELLSYITLRPHVSFCIKHLDMLGHAMYLALGGEIIDGHVDLTELKNEENNNYAKVIVHSEREKGKQTEINQVRCIFNATGAHAAYPFKITRKVCSKIKPLLRTHCAQLNISLPINIVKALTELSIHFLYTSNDSLKVFYGNEQGDTIKVQIYYMLTEQESKLLDKVVEQNFLEHSDFKLIIKTFLLIDFLCVRENIKMEIPDLFTVFLRDQIKKGKSLCQEFFIPQPSFPAQCAIPIAKKAVITWIGAAALPTILNGQFVLNAIAHAQQVINELIKYKFDSCLLNDQTNPGKVFQSWLKNVYSYVDTQYKFCPDTSDEMMKYFEKRFSCIEKKERSSTPVVFKQLNISEVEFTASTPGPAPKLEAVSTTLVPLTQKQETTQTMITEKKSRL